MFSDITHVLHNVGPMQSLRRRPSLTLHQHRLLSLQWCPSFPLRWHPIVNLCLWGFPGCAASKVDYSHLLSGLLFASLPRPQGWRPVAFVLLLCGVITLSKPTGQACCYGWYTRTHRSSRWLAAPRRCAVRGWITAYMAYFCFCFVPLPHTHTQWQLVSN